MNIQITIISQSISSNNLTLEVEILPDGMDSFKYVGSIPWRQVQNLENIKVLNAFVKAHKSNILDKLDIVGISTSLVGTSKTYVFDTNDV